MLQNIKNSVFAKYQPTDIRGFFLTSFDAQSAIISSNGSIEPDKNLDQLIELFYHGIIEKEANAASIVADVVLSVTQAADLAQIQAINLQTQGLCLVGEQGKSGVLLPNTAGVTTIQQALKLVKDKYQLAGNATIYDFTTDRIVVR